ncbi:DUF1289 domain-containing protein [Roseateles sp. BYS180W]|uniref:DUF1289 domain-containing protein n=1 Tax=Roseateles rivi TaxID=3299028 RepID=A0ABW7FZR8_9BURK
MASPCTGVCRIDPCTGWCEGCVRTLDEIAVWRTASSAQRQAILDDLLARQALVRLG